MSPLITNWATFLGNDNRKFVVNNAKRKIALNQLTGKVVGLYWSAHWCPPCVEFTPILADVYQQILKEHVCTCYCTSAVILVHVT